MVVGGWGCCGDTAGITEQKQEIQFPEWQTSCGHNDTVQQWEEREGGRGKGRGWRMGGRSLVRRKLIVVVVVCGAGRCD